MIEYSYTFIFDGPYSFLHDYLMGDACFVDIFKLLSTGLNEVMVCKLYSDVGQDFSCIAAVLPFEVVSCLVGYVPQLKPGSDRLIWKGDESGDFTLKSADDMLHRR